MREGEGGQETPGSGERWEVCISGVAAGPECHTYPLLSLTHHIAWLTHLLGIYDLPTHLLRVYVASEPMR